MRIHQSLFPYILLIMFCPTICIGQNAVKTHEGVSTGGIKQWIGAVSKDDSQPLLLFLHGGPGFSSRSYAKKFIKQLRNDFIIAQWDQRGTGITKAWSPEAPLSLELMQADTAEVIDYLLSKFKKEKLYLVGFSWGNVLGMDYALKHPEKLHAYISVSGLINGLESETQNLSWLKAEASADSNEKAVAELATVSVPFKNWEDLYAQRKWAAYYSNAKHSGKAYPEQLFKDWSNTWMPIFLEALSVNHSQLISQLDCPYFALISKRDHVANYEVAAKFVNSLKGTSRQIIWFEESTHEIPNEEPKKFSTELLNIRSLLFN